MKTMTYLLNLTLLVVCSQFVFADEANTDGKQMYINFEDAQAALPDKEYFKPQDPVTTRSAPDWTDGNPDWYGAYEFPATISGGIILGDGVNIAEEGDIFAAFDELWFSHFTFQ